MLFNFNFGQRNIISMKLTDLFGPLERLIEEHGSSAIQSKHIALLREQLSILKADFVPGEHGPENTKKGAAGQGRLVWPGSGQDNAAWQRTSAASCENYLGHLKSPLFLGPGVGYSTSMSIDQIAPEALRLPPRERALLAASLWESIEDPYVLAADRSDDDVIALALAREAELESGAAKPLSHGELMTRLRG